MSLLRTLLILSAALFTWTPAGSAQMEPPVGSNEEAAALLTRAAEETRLDGRGSAPFHLRARMKSFGAKGDAVDGTYELWWISPEKWRNEITWVGAKTVRIAEKDRIWIAGEDAHRFDTWRLSNAFRFWSRLIVDGGEHIKRVSNKELNGAPAACIELTQNDQTNNFPVWVGDLLQGSVPLVPDRTSCLDLGTGLPLNIEFGFTRVEYDAYRGVILKNFPPLRLEFGAYAKLGAKYFPETLREIQAGTLLFELRLEFLDDLDPGQSNALERPSDAVSRSWCPDMALPVPLHFGEAPPSPLSFPNGAPMVPLPEDFDRLGMLTFEVDHEGRALAVEAFNHKGRVSLKESEKRALLRSAFEPATCQGKPISAEFQIGPPH